MTCKKFATSGVVILATLFLSALLFGCAQAQNNIASTAKCTVSPSPNYPRTAGKNNPSFLVNNQYASASTMWVDPQTLGWSHVSKVTLNFSFDKIYNLSAISLHTAARAAAGVNWPMNIFAFTSLDGQSYQYIGDLMKNADKSGTSYLLRTFSLSGLKNVAGRYVRLVVVPDGAFFFTDEVQIFGSPADSSVVNLNRSERMTENSASLEALTESRMLTARNKKFLIGIGDDLKAQYPGSVRKKMDKIFQDIENADDIDSTKYEAFERELLSTRVQDNLKSGLLISDYDIPWGVVLDVNRFGQPPSSSSNIQVNGYVDGTDYYAFNLFNNTSVTVDAALHMDNPGHLDLQVFDLKNVQTRDFKIVPDALIPLHEGNTIRLSPGMSKIFLISVKSGQSGNFNATVSFSSENGKVSSHLEYRVKDIASYLSGFKPLDIIVWAYYNEPFYKGIQEQVHADLLDHGVNVLVVPPVINNSALFNNNLDPLNSYLKESGGYDYIFLFTNFGAYIKGQNKNFMTASWKSDFLAGFDREIKQIKNHQFKADQIYLYPVDEVSQSEVDSYLSFVKWIKSVRPETKIFTTIYSSGIFDEVKGNADIYQLLIRNSDMENAIENPGKSQIWMYDIMDNEKSLSPYSRFRLLPWRAFLNGSGGIGFWNYASMSGASVWDDFDGDKPDYNVVYNRQGSVISSRRWEAFKKGQEDYRVLSAYAKKYGTEAAKSWCKKVIDGSDNEAYADEAINEMLDKL